MNTELMLVFISAIIAVAAAYPSNEISNEIARNQKYCGDCNWVTTGRGDRFCVTLCEEDDGTECLSGFKGNVAKCKYPSGYCPQFFIRDGWVTVAEFQLCRSRSGRYCYIAPSPSECADELPGLVYMEEDKENCVCLEDDKGNKVCSPRNCDEQRPVAVEQGNDCICMEHGGNKVCTTPHCDVALKQSIRESCICMEDRNGKPVCSPPNCDSN